MLFWCQNETSMWVCFILLCDGNDVYADSFERDAGFLSDYFIFIGRISFVLLLNEIVLIGYIVRLFQ